MTDPAGWQGQLSDLLAAGFPATHTINTEADMAEGKRILNDGTGLSFILFRVQEGPALRTRCNLVPHITRGRFRAALLVG